MILQALYGLAKDEELVPDPDYEPKPVAWLATVDQAGRMVGGFTTTKSEPPEEEPGGKRKRKPKAAPKSYSVPRQPGRTSGAFAFFLCDKAEYALGMDPAGKRKPADLQKRAALFRGKVEDCAQATGDEGVIAAARFLGRVAKGEEPVELPEDCAPNDLFAFVYAPDVERLVSDRQAVRDYWKGLRQEGAGGDAAEVLTCLVSGTDAVPVDKHPSVKNVPGGSTSGIALVSYNSSAFESYGWKGNLNAPVSREAAEACATALNRLMHPNPPDPNRPGEHLQPRNIFIGGNTKVCYWSRFGRGRDFLDELAALFEANPEGVKAAYQSIWKGLPPQSMDDAPFYALVISGGQGRATLRGWFESSLQEAVANLAKHFEDLEVCWNTPPPKKGGLPPAMPLRRLLESLATPGDRAETPAPLAEAVVRSAFQGTPYPFELLEKAVERARAEIGKEEWTDWRRRDARAALVKAVLNRRKRVHPETCTYEEAKRDMDPNNSNPGYLLGRLLAVIERLQQLALGDVKATVVDRFFSAASASPRTAFLRLLKNARHHAQKVRDDDQRRGGARWLEAQIDEICDHFRPELGGFPAWLPLEEQGLFILGYHQQRHWLWKKKADRDAADGPAPAAPTEA